VRPRPMPTALGLLLSIAAGCGGESPTESSPSYRIDVPRADTLAVGASRVLPVTVRDAADQPVPAPALTWSSRAPGVATVDGQGRLQAVGVGRTVVTVRGGGTSVDVAVIVHPVVAELRMAEPRLSLVAGSRAYLVPQAFDAAGTRIAEASFTFGAGGGDVATVAGDGLVSAVATGSGAVTVRSGEVGLQVGIDVVPMRASAFDVELHVDQAMSGRHQQAVTEAAQAAIARWRRIVVGDVPDHRAIVSLVECGATLPIPGDTNPLLRRDTLDIDDLSLWVRVAPVDGVGGLAARSTGCAFSADAPKASIGAIVIDVDDLPQLLSGGRLAGVLAQGIGRGLFSTITRFVPGTNPGGHHFVGPTATRALHALGFPHEEGVHLSGATGYGRMFAAPPYRGELMSGDVATPASVISRISVGALADLGFDVQLGAAEPYSATIAAEFAPP
jgi:hypothetical protein